jgi:hypothetical protein
MDGWTDRKIGMTSKLWIDVVHFMQEHTKLVRNLCFRHKLSFKVKKSYSYMKCSIDVQFWLMWSGVKVTARAGDFSLYHHVQTGSGAHTASYPMGTRDSSLWVKWPGHEADHSPPSSVEVKNVWSYTTTPPLHIHCMVLSWSTGITLPPPLQQ